MGQYPVQKLRLIPIFRLYSDLPNRTLLCNHFQFCHTGNGIPKRFFAIGKESIN